MTLAASVNWILFPSSSDEMEPVDSSATARLPRLPLLGGLEDMDPHAPSLHQDQSGYSEFQMEQPASLRRASSTGRQCGLPPGHGLRWQRTVIARRMAILSGIVQYAFIVLFPHKRTHVTHSSVPSRLSLLSKPYFYPTCPTAFNTSPLPLSTLRRQPTRSEPNQHRLSPLRTRLRTATNADREGVKCFAPPQPFHSRRHRRNSKRM